MLERLVQLDRRWIFLLMLLAVSVPICLQKSFPERPTEFVLAVFNKLEELPEGSRVLFSFDCAPSSDGELAPMMKGLVRHCCLKRHKMLFMTLWPDGKPLIERTITDVIEGEFRDAGFRYGEGYVNLGFSTGNEVVIKGIATNLRNMFAKDEGRVDLDDLPITADVTNLQDMDLLVTISAGYPGSKEWVQYAASPLGIPLAVGATAVQAPQAYPYIPRQMIGILAAIKGAAEYEVALAGRYPRFAGAAQQEGVRRMAPQLSAHLLIIGLIVAGNAIYLFSRRSGDRQ
jgi:hypothetical protein